jgi:cell division protein FtsB
MGTERSKKQTIGRRSVMDHILKALDEHIAYQGWLLKCEISAREELEKEADKLKSENRRLSGLVKDYEAREKGGSEH